jgi:hypothetical protein
MAVAAAVAVAAQAQSAQTAFYPPLHGAPQVQSDAAVAVFWEPNGIVRSKNVSRVGHPSIGIYCVRATVSLNTSEIVPIATPEFTGSTVKAMYVYVVDNKVDCPEHDTVDIRTYALSGGSAVLSDGVSFYMSIV